jgi:hypothetical protein
MKTLLLVFPFLFSCFLCLAQDNPYRQEGSYHQSHKEIEYAYGVIADEDLERISEIEKIKYELKYAERSVIKTIDKNMQTTLDITIDSNGYEQPWMNLAKRFTYTNDNIKLFDKNGERMQSIDYTDEQREDNYIIQEDIKENGFHPGLVAFPEFTDEIIEQLRNEGISITNNEDGSTTIEHEDGETETYNPLYLTITREWKDEEGFKNKETNGYIPYLVNRGYLLRLSKTERFINSVNGPCITEVKLIYYSDYQIQDDARLIDQVTGNIESVAIYPNPNDGIFSVAVKISEETGNQIVETRIVNLMDGEEFYVNREGQNDFVVEIPDLRAGHYVLRVVTYQSVLSTHFFKQ